MRTKSHGLNQVVGTRRIVIGRTTNSCGSVCFDKTVKDCQRDESGNTLAVWRMFPALTVMTVDSYDSDRCCSLWSLTLMQMRIRCAIWTNWWTLGDAHLQLMPIYACLPDVNPVVVDTHCFRVVRPIDCPCQIIHRQRTPELLHNVYNRLAYVTCSVVSHTHTRA